jgi:acetylornithine deacetylase/succinyl-diaminopimelate desuccinylase-like protein
LIADRHEGSDLPTLLMYAHGDVIRGQDEQWAAGRSPWTLSIEQGRLYGRGTADNKGQWTVNIGALEAIHRARGGQLGFNTRILVETAEERGSPGLQAFCRKHADKLAADLFIASDGPRLSADTPTLFLGSRGILNFELALNLREGAHHSGNWGGLLRNPGTVLASAIASLVDANGVITTPLLRPQGVPQSVLDSVRELPLGGQPGDPAIDDGWGQPGLSPAQRLFAWNTLEVLGLECGTARRAIGAIPATARAVLQLRHVVDTDLHDIEHRLQHRAGAGDPPEPGRDHPQRRLRGRSASADPLGAALLPRVLAACAERAPAGIGLSTGPGDHGRLVLGSRRAGPCLPANSSATGAS